ncbi:MAG: hypothetical protein WAL25_13275, partial [Acidimicrobiia bacterium]
MTATRRVTDAGPGRRRSAMPAAVVSIARYLVGILGLVIGLGFGVRWLSVEGLTLVSAAGLLLLLGGAVTLVLSVRSIATARSGMVRGLAIALVSLVAAVAVWTLTPAVIATVVPPIEPGVSTPADYGMDARAVSYTTRD